jgi:hypothetical protein
LNLNTSDAQRSSIFAQVCLLAALLSAGPAAGADPAPSLPRVHSSSVALPAHARVDGVRVAEISGLAWDPEAQRLYAVSDSGHLFRFRLLMQAGELVGVEPLSAVPLKPVAGAPGKGATDAEGLAWRSEGGVPELLVATEGTPKVWRIGTQGEALGEAPLPAALADATRYAAPNTMLEAVAVHPTHGLLLAPEQGLRGEDPLQGHRVHGRTRHWNVPSMEPGVSRLKAMDVMEDGSLLILERSGGGKRLRNALRHVDLSRCQHLPACKPATLALLDRRSGAENFEGMAYLGQRQVLLVSDNRGKKDGATVFLLLQLPPSVASTSGP